VPDAPPAFHLLAKPTDAVCNLDCSYCFFLSKEMLSPGSRFRMADELRVLQRPVDDQGASGRFLRYRDHRHEPTISPV
jgi:sulfatase maturation enzyme AslB (radical SAM superfamily)